MQNTSNKKIHRAFTVVAGLILLMLPGSLIQNTSGLFYTPICESLGIKLSEYSLHMTIMSIAGLVIAPLVVMLFDKFDSRITVTFAVVVEAAVFIVNSFAQSVYVFYFTALLMAFCYALILNHCIHIVVNKWFAVRAATIIGICGSAQGVGGAIFNALGGFIIEQYGWRICYLVWTAVILMIGLPAAVFMIRKDPAELGLKPYGYDESKSTGEAQRSNSQLAGVSLKQAMKSPVLYMCGISVSLIGAVATLNFYMTSYLTAQDIALSAAGTITSAVMFGNILGKIAIGMYLDKKLIYGPIFGVLPGFVAMLLLVFVAGGNVPLLLISFFLFGMSYGVATVMGSVLVKNIFGFREFAKIWTVMGMMLGIFSSPVSTIWALVVENFGYHTAMLVGAGLYVVAVILALAAIKFSARIKDNWTVD